MGGIFTKYLPERLRCDHCGRFVKADDIAICDFDYDLARKAGFDVDETNSPTIDILLAPFQYALDAGECVHCGEIVIFFAGPRHYWNPQTQQFDIEGVLDA